MIRSPHFRGCLARLASFGWREDRAAQLVEFAVALPLLVLFVVGIFDFSNAFTFKQKLTNIARDAARVAAGDPASDLQSPSTSAPASVIDAFYIVDNYMVANNISDCGIKLNNSPTTVLTWTSVSTSSGNGCQPGDVVITINRGYYFADAVATQPVGPNCSTPQLTSALTVVVGTCVSVQHAYPWRFGRIASVFGASTALPTSITGTAVAMNEN